MQPVKEPLNNARRVFDPGILVFQVAISETAEKKLKVLIEENGKGETTYLRVYVTGGGCSGMAYGMALDDKLKDGDEVVHNNGIKLVADQESREYLNGSKVDYVESVQGTGFTISNPTNWSTCGCGKSFTQKGEEPPDAGHGGGHEGHNH